MDSTFSRYSIFELIIYAYGLYFLWCPTLIKKEIVAVILFYLHNKKKKIYQNEQAQ